MPGRWPPGYQDQRWTLARVCDLIAGKFGVTGTVTVTAPPGSGTGVAREQGDECLRIGASPAGDRVPARPTPRSR